MRTTMNLPDSLLEAVRARAEQEGRTMTSLMEEALRALLDRQRDTASPARLPTDGIAHSSFVIDIDDREALAAALDADGIR